jgi:hypothetical protein
MGFAGSAVRLTGETRQFRSKGERGVDAVRNFCPVCGSLLFGGEVGVSDLINIYAGSLDDPSMFQPKTAIVARSRRSWAPLPPDLKVFDALPTRRPQS